MPEQLPLEKRIPADYSEMDILEARRFDVKVKENFMLAYWLDTKNGFDLPLNRSFHYTR